MNVQEIMIKGLEVEIKKKRNLLNTKKIDRNQEAEVEVEKKKEEFHVHQLNHQKLVQQMLNKSNKQN
jgi:hypothetical protein